MPEAIRQDDRDPATLSPDFALGTERLKLALDVGRTGIWMLDTKSNRMASDVGMAALLGLPESAVLDMPTFLSLLHHDDAERVAAGIREAGGSAGENDAFTIEFRVKRESDGAERWIAMHGRRFRPAQGGDDALELVGMARDITSRKQRESHLHLLMREVTHRSKNLLAIIQAMARQTVKDSLTAADFEERFSARLRGLAVSHDLLAARDWHGAAMSDLVRWQLGQVLETVGARISIQGPTLFLKPEAAQNIGLAFNELTTNALRFGALSGPKGEVAIEWSIDPVGKEPRRFHISWRESGGPEVKPPHRTGFGHKVVERLAARALDGNVSLTFAASGVQWSLHIPASFVLEDVNLPSVN